MKRKINTWIRYAADRGYTVDQFGSVYGTKGQLIGILARRHTRMHYATFSTKLGRIKVHRFVAFLKYGRRALRKGVVVRHRDGDSMNNAWDNILLGNQSQNERDKPIDVHRRNYERMVSQIGGLHQREQPVVSVP